MHPAPSDKITTAILGRASAVERKCTDGWEKTSYIARITLRNKLRDRLCVIPRTNTFDSKKNNHMRNGLAVGCWTRTALPKPTFSKNIAAHRKDCNRNCKIFYETSIKGQIIIPQSNGHHRRRQPRTKTFSNTSS